MVEVDVHGKAGLVLTLSSEKKGVAKTLNSIASKNMQMYIFSGSRPLNLA